MGVLFVLVFVDVADLCFGCLAVVGCFLGILC